MNQKSRISIPQKMMIKTLGELSLRQRQQSTVSILSYLAFDVQ